MTAAPPEPIAHSRLASSSESIRMVEEVGKPIIAVKLAKRQLSPPQKRKLRDVEIIVLGDRCKGCAFCIEYCPRDVLEQDTRLNVRGVHAPRVKDSALCVGCGICEEICPDLAIFLVDKRESP